MTAINGGITLTLDIEKLTSSSRLRPSINLDQMPHGAMSQAEDLAIGVGHGILKGLAQDQYELIRVELPHEPLVPESEYEAYFGAPVVFNSNQSALYVSPGTLNTCLLQRSEQLHRIAADYLNVQFPSTDGLSASRVETAVRRTLGTHSCNRESVAQAMAMHPRTLQLRLKEEGTSFDDIRDSIRRETVEHYLCHTNMPLSQVAGMVGYSEQAILTRSCQRWFGQTPRQIRNSPTG